MSAGPPWTVIVADDHAVVRLGVRMLLSNAPDFTIVGEAGDGEAAVRLVRRFRPDLLVLDLSMPKLPGLETLRELADDLATMHTVILTADIEQRQILEALQLGARGIVLKNDVAEHLVEALRTVMKGLFWIGGVADTSLRPAPEPPPADDRPRLPLNLTAREREVVAAIVEGCTNRDIARKFSISEETVKRHLTNIFDKTGVSTRLELAMFAVHHRL